MPAYKRILLKLSGEALMGDDAYGINRATIVRMVREIRGFAVLEGARGAPPADVAALASMLSALSRFAAVHADLIDSIDLNPVLVMPEGEGIVPLDALLVPRHRQ